MVVEFFGLPGAGKSTLACHVADRLAARGVPVKRSPRVLSHASGKVERIVGKGAVIAAEIARHPFHAGRAARAVAATRQRTAADLARTLANWLYVGALLRRGAGAAEVRLVEQGLAQALWSIGFSAGHLAWADVISRHGVLVLAPDLVVLVQADLDVIRGRLASRGANVRLEQALERDPTVLERSSTLLSVAMRLLEERGIPVVTVRNERPASLATGAAVVAGRVAAGCEGRTAA